MYQPALRSLLSRHDRAGRSERTETAMQTLIRLPGTPRRAGTMQSPHAGTVGERRRFRSPGRRQAPAWVVGGIASAAMAIVIGSFAGTAFGVLPGSSYSTSPTYTVSPTYTSPYT